MGIEGLLRSLQPILILASCFKHDDANNNNIVISNQSKKKKKKKTKVQSIHNVRSFVNCSLAIDASSWLHKAGYSISESLVEAVEQQEHNSTMDWQRKYPHIVQSLTNYMVKRCTELFDYAGIAQITLVFDGELRCPLKLDTNDNRSNKRAANLSKARLLKSQGQQREASEYYRACVKVPFSLSMCVQQKIAGKNHPKLQCVVAPYEADAQLAKLVLDGICHAIVTEDSDLLVYSAAIGIPFPIIYKLDRDSGACDIISMSWLFTSPKNMLLNDLVFGEEKENYSSILLPGMNNMVLKTGSKFAQYLQAFQLKEKVQPGYGRRLFVQACVLAGCDYTINSTLALDGIGLITACKLIVAHAHQSHEERFRHVLRDWKGSCSKTCERVGSEVANLEDYEELLAKSEAVFYYHHVYCRSTNIVLPLQCWWKGHSLTSVDNNREPNIVQVKKEESMEMPTMCRFGSSISFLGTGITTAYYTSHIKGFQPRNTTITSGTQDWISKKAGTRSTHTSGTQDWISKKAGTHSTPYSYKKTAIPHYTSGDIRVAFQALSQKRKVRPFSELQTHQVGSAYDNEAEDVDGIDSLVILLNEDTDSVIRSSSILSCLPRKEIFHRSELSSASIKTISSSETCKQNRFLSFAHKSQEQSLLVSDIRPKNGKPLLENAVTPLRAHASIHTEEKTFSDDDESVPSSVPPKPSVNVEFSTSKRLAQPFLDQFLATTPLCSKDSVDEEEEVPSSYPTELANFDGFYSPSFGLYTNTNTAHLREGRGKASPKSSLASNARRVSTGSPYVDDESIESCSPFSSKKRDKRSTHCLEKQTTGTKVAIDGTNWTDDDSDCCILDSTYASQTHFSSCVSDVNLHDDSGWRRSCEYSGSAEEIIPPRSLFSQGSYASSFSTSRKKTKTNNDRASNSCNPSNTLMSRFAWQQDAKVIRQGSHFAGERKELKSLNHTIPWRQTSINKETNGPSKRGIKDFFAPLLTSNIHQPR